MWNSAPNIPVAKLNNTTFFREEQFDESPQRVGRKMVFDYNTALKCVRRWQKKYGLV